MRMRCLWSLLAFLLVCAPLRVVALNVPEDERHQVFAHYMVCFANTVEFYKQEIMLAQSHGIDGFVLNCGDWLQYDAQGKTSPGPYVQSAERIYEAARQLNSGFKLFMSPDLSGIKPERADIGDMVMRFYHHPNQFRYRGTPVLSGYAGLPAVYAPAIQKLKDDGYPVVFVPVVSTPRSKMAWSTETVYRIFANQPHMDGVFMFACDGTVHDMVRQNAINRRVTQELGKIYMAGNCPAYNSPNLREYRGTQGYCALWEGIIRDDADWVEVVTWSDYQEDTNLMPYRWKDGWEKDAYDRDASFLDLTAYYSAWFKTGVRPAITQDKIYFTYRTRNREQTRAWDAKANTWVDITSKSWPYDQIHDDVHDAVYITSFLTAPATLTVALGGKDTVLKLPAGVNHAETAFRPGVPRFTLRRDGKVLADVSGRQQIITAETMDNSTLGAPHLQYRTWASGLAVGPVTRLEAANGTRNKSALVSVGRVKAVQITAQDGSGVTLPVHGLATATYNVRIIYSNPTTLQARLTLQADGPPSAPGQYPYYFPAFLPPTKPGEFATTSFLWPLYENTSYLQLSWLAGGKNAEWDDRGSALIQAIELVKVDPVAQPAAKSTIWPELVSIPGGTFRMGSANGVRDERPVHQVTLSPFVIGKYEVTNAEYERFDPSHRAQRDSYSWRNNEPVIYVSWLDAVRYCNWLSTQAGLTPVYDEKTWTTNRQADGFRLPTEAEWEYVASGRGEGRAYPWGNQSPDAKYGNFLLAASLDMGTDLRSGETPGGVMVVGSYPAGASRDGVMDLAGNVAEWCSDWLTPYTADAQTDPCSLTPTNHRAIRGGSWGYYNYSQRCADREFNNPGYPGYIYLGFRIAISEAGLRKLQSAGK